MSCEFTVPYIGTQTLLAPSSDKVASINGSRVSIRSIANYEVTHIFQCIDKIDKIEFSTDSNLIMCALYCRNAIQVFSLVDKSWTCRINEGVAGVINAYWAPDSRSIITESDFGIQLSVWSLIETNSSLVISMPKPRYNSGSVSSLQSNWMYQTATFSSCGRLFAVLLRPSDMQDRIGIYSLSNADSNSDKPLSGGAGELSKFRCRSNDAAGVHWLSGGKHILTVDSPLHYRFCVYTPMGEMIVSYEAYQNALGIQSLSLPPLNTVERINIATKSPTFIALGSYDCKVRLLSNSSFQLAFVLPLAHPAELPVGVTGKDTPITLEVSSLSSAMTHSATATLDSTGKTGNGGTVVDNNIATSKIVSSLKTGVTLLSDNGIAAERKLTLMSAQSGKENLRNDTCFIFSTTTKALPKSAFSSSSKSTVGKKVEKSSAQSGIPTVGVSWLQWENCCDERQLLAARSESHPRCIWIWHATQAKLLALVVCLEAITFSQWRPIVAKSVAPESREVNMDETSTITESRENSSSPLLTFCTGSNRVYFWTPEGGTNWAELPQDSGSIDQSKGRNSGQFAITRLSWSNDGRTLLLQGKETYCFCHVHFDGNYQLIRVA